MIPPRVRSVTGSNFGSYPSFKLELPETGLMLLRGVNEETGGSSGCGKSTLIQAICYPIGVCDVPTTELQSWGSDAIPVVTEHLTFGEKTVDITYGKRFQLEIDGKAFPGSAAQKNEEIDRLFGMSAEMRRALTYRGQRKPGLFLSKTDLEKKVFLTQLLGLDKFEDEMDATKERIDKLERECAMFVAELGDCAARIDQEGPAEDVDGMRGYILTLTAEVERHTEAVAHLEDSITDARRRATAAYSDYIQGRMPELKPLRLQLERMELVVIEKTQPSVELIMTEATVTECGKRIERLTTEDTNARWALETQRRKLNAAIQEVTLKAGAVNGFRADKDRITAELVILAKDVCPVCSREWALAQERRDQLAQDMLLVEDQIACCVEFAAQVEEMKADLAAVPKFEPNPMIEAMRKAQADARTQAAQERQKLEGAYDLKAIELERAKAETRSQIERLGREIESAGRLVEAELLAGVEEMRDQKEAHRQLLATARSDRDGMLRTLGDAEARWTRIKSIQDKIDTLSAKRDAVAQKLHAERDFLHLIGREGFLGAIFDEVLAEISEETNQVLASIANTRNCTIKFASDSVTQKGTVRKEIVPVVTINGHKASLKFGPSGGMISAIELAVDLAVGHVISRRTGVCPGWLILDEPFDGLGTVEKETCLDILTRYSNERLVIVVDHSTETQGLFTNKVEIRYKDGVSRLV